MSTELAEAPVKTTEVKTPDPERAARANSFLNPGTPNRPTPELPKVAEVKKEEPTKVEPVKKAEEAKVTTPVVTDPKENSIAELRRMRDEARKQNEELQKQFEAEKAERARVAAEYETFKQNPIPKEFQEKLTKTEQEREQIRQELRAASLERDPLFRKEYNDRINASAAQMRDLMVQSGVDVNEANKAATAWDENFFTQALSNMNPVQEVKFKAAWMQAEQIETERRAALKNAEGEWTRRQEQMAAQQKAQQEQGHAALMADKESLFKEMFSQEHLRDNKDLQEAARQSVDASFNMPPKELMRHVASARLLAEGIKIKEAELQKLRNEHEELKKKHDEQEAFIKNQNGGTARLSPSDAAEKPEDKKARALSFLNPTAR